LTLIETFKKQRGLLHLLVIFGLTVFLSQKRLLISLSLPPQEFEIQKTLISLNSGLVKLLA
jgi:hypothetical protein